MTQVMLETEIFLSSLLPSSPLFLLSRRAFKTADEQGEALSAPPSPEHAAGSSLQPPSQHGVWMQPGTSASVGRPNARLFSWPMRLAGTDLSALCLLNAVCS